MMRNPFFRNVFFVRNVRSKIIKKIWKCAKLLRLQRCRRIHILQISKNVLKWVLRCIKYSLAKIGVDTAEKLPEVPDSGIKYTCTSYVEPSRPFARGPFPGLEFLLHRVDLTDALLYTERNVVFVLQFPENVAQREGERRVHLRWISGTLEYEARIGHDDLWAFLGGRHYSSGHIKLKIPTKMLAPNLILTSLSKS